MNTPQDKSPAQPSLDLPVSYPPVGSLEQGNMGELPLYTPKSTKKMDWLVSVAMTFLGVVAIFVVLIVLLKSLSPSAPDALVPTSRGAAATDSTERPGSEEIVGD